jgi:hypothetical protein
MCIRDSKESIGLGAEVLREEIPVGGVPSDQATLALSTTCEAVAFSTKDEKILATEILNRNIENMMMPVNDEILTEKMTKVNFTDDGRYGWTGRATRILIPLFEKNELAGSISGKNIDDARQILVLSFTQLQSPEILINPAWWRLLPFLPTRIYFEFGGK